MYQNYEEKRLKKRFTIRTVHGTVLEHVGGGGGVVAVNSS